VAASARCTTIIRMTLAARSSTLTFVGKSRYIHVIKLSTHAVHVVWAIQGCDGLKPVTGFQVVGPPSSESWNDSPEATVTEQRPESDSPQQHLSGCLTRLCWMLIGNFALLITAALIAKNHQTTFSLADIVF